MRNRQGRFIVFEGVEGAGKSTQIAALAAHLQERGVVARTTFEPGDTRLGQEIRRLAMHLRDPAPAPMAELLLYLADRAQHLAEVVRPAMARGEVVLCDRFSASTIVYQGFARGLDREHVGRMDAIVRAGVKPSLTLVLDCPVALGLQRAHGDDRFHAEKLDFHERVRRGFLLLAAQDPATYRVIDAARTASEVEQQILNYVLDHLA